MAGMQCRRQSSRSARRAGWRVPIKKAMPAAARNIPARESQQIDQSCRRLWGGGGGGGDWHVLPALFQANIILRADRGGIRNENN